MQRTLYSHTKEITVKKLILTLLAAIAVSAQAADLTGAGATFPYPIYSKWAEAYKSATGIGLNYQSIGSGGGIRQIKGKTVDFGASDMPLKQDELDKDGLMQFPAIIGGVVPVVNIEGVAAGQLKLTPQVIADIYMGKITKWDHKSITEINPGLKLPSANIAVVHRSDGSGTTFIWTNWLSKTVPEWADKIKDGPAVKWPVGVGGKGNEGVSNIVQQLKNSIGYVEYAYAKRNKIPHAQVRNRAGNFVQPDDATFKAAAAGADWANAPGFYLLLTDQSAKDAWPITGASFILMHRQQAEALTGRAVLKFFDWSYKNGAKMSEELEYVHLPSSVISLVQNHWKTQLKDKDGNAIWK